MGNFKHQSIRTANHDRERDVDREADRDSKVKEGNERLRNVVVFYPQSQFQAANLPFLSYLTSTTATGVQSHPYPNYVQKIATPLHGSLLKDSSHRVVVRPKPENPRRRRMANHQKIGGEVGIRVTTLLAILITCSDRNGVISYWKGT